MTRSKVKSKSHHDIAHLHPEPMSLPSINILYFMVSEIEPDNFFFQQPNQPNAIGESNTYTVFKGCGVKINMQLIAHYFMFSANII